MNDSVNNQSKENSHHKRRRKNPKGNDFLEHNIVGLDGVHNKGMKSCSKEKSRSGTDYRKDYVFAENIGRNLVIIKTENLDGRDFADSFGNVDVGKVIKNNKSQSRRANDYQNYNIIKIFDHALERFHGILREER